MDELEEIRKRKIEMLKEKMRGNNIKIKIEADDTNFEENVIEKSKMKPVVVDFWAPWCMPCNMLSPILDKLAEEHKGNFVLAKVNVDQAKMTAMKYGIMSIPSVKLFKDGKVVDGFIGAMPEPMVRGWLDKNLN